MTRWSAWAKLWWMWVPVAVLVVANVVWMAGLRSSLIGRGSLIGRRVTDLEDSVRRLEARERQLASSEARLEALHERLTELREKQLAPMRDRLVPFLIDVVDRSREAGLSPLRIGYQVQVDDKTGLAHFVATYELTGRYEQIRQLIYLLESSPQFVVIERLGLNGTTDASSLEVKVALSVGTYFSDVDEELLKELKIKGVKGEPASD